MSYLHDMEDKVIRLTKEIKQLHKLCKALMGEELLYRDGQYETEMSRQQAKIKRLRISLSNCGHYAQKVLDGQVWVYQKKLVGRILKEATEAGGK